MWKITIVLLALAFCVYAEEPEVSSAAAAVETAGSPADAAVAEPGLDDGAAANPDEEPTVKDDTLENNDKTAADASATNEVPTNPGSNATDNLDAAKTTDPTGTNDTEDSNSTAETAESAGDSGNKENGTDSKRDSENKFPFNFLTMPSMPNMPPMPSFSDMISNMPTFKPITADDIASMTPGPDGEVYGASSSISKNVVMENGKEVVHEVQGSTTINNNGNVTTTTF